jgi:hypothetical protein
MGPPSSPQGIVLGFGAIAITKPYQFIGFGAIAITKPHKFIGFGAIAIAKPYKFTGFGAGFYCMAGVPAARPLDGSRRPRIDKSGRPDSPRQTVTVLLLVAPRAAARR